MRKVCRIAIICVVVVCVCIGVKLFDNKLLNSNEKEVFQGDYNIVALEDDTENERKNNVSNNLLPELNVDVEDVGVEREQIVDDESENTYEYEEKAESGDEFLSVDITDNYTLPKIDKVYEKDNCEMDIDREGVSDSAENILGTESSEEVSLNINTEMFLYNESVGWYVVDSEISKLSGKLKGLKDVKSIAYEIRDINNSVVKDGIIDIAENWILNDLGLSIGYNEINIIINEKNGKSKVSSIVLFNNNIANLDRLNVDLSDGDGDGLNFYYETLLKTDDSQVDTDGDQLTDYDEFLYTGTDATLRDTDENGVSDCDEDWDKDGLSNLIEIQYGTNCFIADCDGDGLIDGDEVKVYLTNPLCSDTDGDNLGDFREVQLGLEPLEKDTDSDGISDAEELIFQTYKKNINNDDKREILSVQIDLECKGFLEDKATITDVYNVDIRSSEVVGLIGVPVEIWVDNDFVSAEITFYYDETKLGNTDEENLVMMWYDEENDQYIVLDSVVDVENNTVTYTTTHFSTYLLVDKQIWFDAMRKNIDYRNLEDAVYYDIAFVVDVSSSMSGERLDTAKTALNKFVDAMLEEDRATLVIYNGTAATLVQLTNDRETLRKSINSLRASGGTNADYGFSLGLRRLEDADENKEKMLILVSDGTVYYSDVQIYIQSAKEDGIKIHCINVVDGSGGSMEKIAYDTGGNYYYATTTEEIEDVIEELRGDTIGTIDITDTDGDGLYDVYEKKGMRLSNGTIVYTDPQKSDTDGDGICDYDAMGGEPVVETFMLDDNIYSCILNHSKVYGKLPEEFIYVDGKINTNGLCYDDEMSYIPYSNNFLYEKYQQERASVFDGETRTVSGEAGVYNSFKDKLATISKVRLLKYAAYGTYTVMAVSLIDTQAASCLNTYIKATGGSSEGLVEGSTREYIYATPRLGTNIFGINSANTYFIENMNRARIAVESVLNEYNTEVYIALAPTIRWTGCAYNDCTMSDWHQNIDSLLNIGAFGIYNKADAAITLHCVYDSETELYTMEFIYYIIDLYDFGLYDELNEMNALGLARCYELYGVASGMASWNKGEELNNYWMY